MDLFGGRTNKDVPVRKEFSSFQKTRGSIFKITFSNPPSPTFVFQFVKGRFRLRSVADVPSIIRYVHTHRTFGPTDFSHFCNKSYFFLALKNEKPTAGSLIADGTILLCTSLGAVGDLHPSPLAYCYHHVFIPCEADQGEDLQLRQVMYRAKWFRRRILKSSLLSTIILGIIELVPYIQRCRKILLVEIIHTKKLSEEWCHSLNISRRSCTSVVRICRTRL